MSHRIGERPWRSSGQPTSFITFCQVNDSESSLESLIVTRGELSHSVKNVTRVESSHHLSQRDSSRIRVTKNRDSSRVIDSSHAITATKSLWLSVKSFSDLCTNKHKRCCYLSFSLSLVYNELRNVFVCIATHFLAIFIMCKFAFCFYS